MWEEDGKRKRKEAETRPFFPRHSRRTHDFHLLVDVAVGDGDDGDDGDGRVPPQLSFSFLKIGLSPR